MRKWAIAVIGVAALAASVFAPQANAEDERECGWRYEADLVHWEWSDRSFMRQGQRARWNVAGTSNGAVNLMNGDGQIYVGVNDPRCHNAAVALVERTCVGYWCEYEWRLLGDLKWREAKDVRRIYFPAYDMTWYGTD